MVTPRTTVSLIMLGLIALVGAGSYLLGQRNAQQADWHTVTVERADVVSNGGDHRLLSVKVDGWTYAMETSVDYWVDLSGSKHQGGWPGCLEPPAPGDTPDRNPGEVTFRFASVEVDSDVVDWRPVVAVDCRV